MANVSISTIEFAPQIQVQSNHVGPVENVHIVYERDKHKISGVIIKWSFGLSNPAMFLISNLCDILYSPSLLTAFPTM